MTLNTTAAGLSKKPTRAMLVLLTSFLMMTVGSLSAHAQTYGTYEDDLTVRVAMQLARAAEIIPESDMTEIVQTLDTTKKVPPRYREKFKKLLVAAQYILQIRNGANYFPVGYEFESAHANKSSLDDFHQGARSILENVKETFGGKSAPKFEIKTVNRNDKTLGAKMADEDSLEWNIVQEWVRDGENTAVSAGWETVSPPIFNRDRLRNLAEFILRLGSNQFGREAEFTGAHQTFNLIPQGGKSSDRIVGLTATNFILLQQQFMPAIFNLLRVERYGSYKNFFIRPMVFDHENLLRQLSQTSPDKLTIQDLDHVMNQTYAQFEFYHHVIHTDAYSQKEKDKMLAWPKEEQINFAKLWKYRDLRVHFNKEKPGRTLMETRIGDYRAGAPEDMLNITYFYQQLLNTAYTMALNDSVYKIDIPSRLPNETDDSYWLRLKTSPAAQEANLFKTLGIDANTRGMMKGLNFKTTRPQMSASQDVTMGFEMEMQSENIVNLIVPIDAKMRAKWRKMDQGARKRYLKSKLEFEFGVYTKDNFRLLVGEFQGDNFKFPFLDPDLFLEESGNLETKSHGRGLTDVTVLNSELKQIEAELKGDYFGMHVHLFMPEEKLQLLRHDPVKAAEFVSMLERLSFFMQTQDYKDVDRSEPTHQVDSWSLDRFSPKDLQMILSYLIGKGKLDNMSQKYHNIGIRVVKGGLDIEFRALGDDIEYANKLLALVRTAIEKLDFGVPVAFGTDRALLHEPRDLSPRDVEDITVANALAKKFQLTEQQKKIAMKLQYEIYKPSMPEYMDFYDGKEHYTHETAQADRLDPAQARTNFESNVAIPILNYFDQSCLKLTPEQKQRIEVSRDAFLTQVYKMVVKIESDPKAKFILDHDNFLYLADWMDRSTHPTAVEGRIQLAASGTGPANKAAASAQRRYLERTVYSLRRGVLDFIEESEVDQDMWASVDLATSHAAPMAKGRVRTAKAARLGVLHPVSSAKSEISEGEAPCGAIFKKE